MFSPIADPAIRQLCTDARTTYAFDATPVSNETLNRLYQVMKDAPDGQRPRNPRLPKHQAYTILR
ncbi:MAG: hypothetical protein ACYYNF_05455 [Actinomycetes bacterium]|jgi:hypothetical protein|nr:hypothetical protein [Candidatus Nanopelagicales bacterium]